MQEISTKQTNTRENSPIKQRIMQYLNAKGITLYSFYQKSGITRNILSQNNGLSEDNLHKFLAYAQDISLNWLIFGQGEMLEKNFQENDSPKMTAQNDSPKLKFDSPKRQPKTDQNSKYDTPTEKNFQENVYPKMSTQNVHPKHDFVHPKCPSKTEKTNAFHGMSDKEVENEIRIGFQRHLLEMYESGRAAPAIEVRRYQREIKALTAQVAKLEYQLGEIMIKQAIAGYSKHRNDDDTSDIPK